MKIVAWLASALSGLDPAPKPIDSAKPPVVVVHGIHATAKDMTRLVRALRADGREVFAPTLTPNDGTASIEELAKQLDAAIAEHVKRGPFDLIGYSMGGVVTRYYLQRLDGLKKVRRYVTLSAPHHGTILARMNWGAGGKEMRRDSALLAELNSAADGLRAVAFTSFWTPTDLIIVPARSSEMPQAHNVRAWGLGHFSFIFEPRCIRRVVAALK
ncbi:MAG: alpha/beta fold hydrolase [Verrucomicrobiales bacterium]|nr:alpha/beta fold hydrolase [Verrucomicrobiales bacterium]MCP5560012.1 alpha/beta fold hydrolase [Verrucomicrobiaceae bacterium]